MIEYTNLENWHFQRRHQSVFDWSILEPGAVRCKGIRRVPFALPEFPLFPPNTLSGGAPF